MGSHAQATEPYIGCRISLESQAFIRYEGVLLQIDPIESTITLSNGTCVDAFVFVGCGRGGYRARGRD